MTTTYKEALKISMESLATDKNRIFLGYNCGCGGMANGTLKDIPKDKLIECPVAENLIVGMAIGLSLEGWKPVIWIERMDFLINCLDSIVNHLDKIERISRGEYSPSVLIRTCVGGSKKPLFTGITHNSNYAVALEKMLGMPVWALGSSHEVLEAYQEVRINNKSAILIEFRDKYDE
jgi:pyruvate/2-oxoglutarate/acetoin dehydrogenase E1 component